MPYNSKPGARKYGNNPNKPAAPTAFKMRSGNHEHLPFKEMGSTPANFGLMDAIGAFGGDKGNKNITAPGSDDKGIKINEAKTEKVKPQEIKIKGSDKTTNTSSRPEDNATAEQRMGSDFVTNKPEPNETKTETETSAPEPEKKKGLFGRYRDYVKSEDYHKNKDSINEAANVIGNTNKHQTNSAEKYNKDKNQKKATQLATEATTRQNAENEVKSTQNAEMHKSKLAVNEQQIANGKALADQRNQKVEIQKEANSKENELAATTPSANSGGEDLSEEETILG